MAEVDARLITAEYTLRLKWASDRAREAKENFDASSRTEPERVSDLLDIIFRAEWLARNGLKNCLLTDITSGYGIQLAADAILRAEEVKGFVPGCVSVPTCASRRICAMNNLIDRLILDGYDPVDGMRVHYPVPYDVVADGCPKMETPDDIMVRRRAASAEHYSPERGAAW